MLRIGARRLALPSNALPTPILTIGSVMSLALLGDALLYVALPAHAADLGLPLWTVGVLLGANRIVRLITNGLAATLFTRIGARGPVVGASIFSVVTTATYGLMPMFLPFLIARLAWGTCFSMLRLGAFTVVLAASQPGTRGRLVGLYQSISRVGPVASLLVGGVLVETLGYHATFVILGLATSPAILLALTLPSSAYRPKLNLTPRHHPSSESTGLRRSAPMGPLGKPPPHGPLPHAGEGESARDWPVGSPSPRRRGETAKPRGSTVRGRGGWEVRFTGWRERWFGGRRLVAVKLGMLANSFSSQGVVLATLTLALADVAGTTEGAAAIGGLLVAFRWGADLFLAPACGHLSDRIGRGRMIPALLAIEAVAVAGLSMSVNRMTVISTTLVVFLTSTAVTAASDAAAGDLAPPERRAQVMSGYSDWMDIGAALGPPLAFVLAERLGLFPSYGCTAVLLIVVAGWFVLAWRRR